MDSIVHGVAKSRTQLSNFHFNNNIFSFPDGSMVKESTWNAGYPGSIPGLGRSPGGGHGNPLQYSCLENLMSREAWQAAVHGVTKSWTQLSDWTQTHNNVSFTSAFCKNINSYFTLISHFSSTPFWSYLLGADPLCPQTLCNMSRKTRGPSCYLSESIIVLQRKQKH